MDLQPIHEPPQSFLKRWVFSGDHKVIAKQFLWAGLLFLAFGGLLAMMIRWQWAYPGEKVPVLGDLFLSNQGGVITPATYATLFTTHGLIMVFWAITPLLIGAFGNLAIPLMIGARDMAFPWLNMASFWVFFVSQLIVIASFFVEMGSAAAGWTTYPPLSTNVGTPGYGQSLMVLGLFVTGISTIMGALNYITTVIRFRAPGMTYMRMPLTVWGLFLTSILNALFVPVLGSAGLLLLCDRTFGTSFFIAGAAGLEGMGDPVVFQHLFWIFGHPEVYILILPAWGIVGDLVSFFTRKPHYWYKGSVFAMITVTVVSAVVYGHHMYVTGMNPLLSHTFMLLTLIISIPAEVLFLNWLHTMWKGSMELTSPMLFALGTIFVFGLGGLTGIVLGTISTDIYLHDTMWVVGHFHFTMASATFFAIFAGLYFWFPKMYGRMMDEKLGRVHFAFSLIFITLVFGGQLVAGYGGHQRRLYDPYQYTFLEHLLPLNRAVSHAAFMLAFGQLFFVINFFKSMFAGEKAGNNPWQVGTLEWTVSSPPPYHNFDVIPTVVRGPHEFANPHVKTALGKDYLDQTEPMPEGIQEPQGALAQLA
jgi:cytochrome c oxidase subunit 1